MDSDQTIYDHLCSNQLWKPNHHWGQQSGLDH